MASLGSLNSGYNKPIKRYLNLIQKNTTLYIAVTKTTRRRCFFYSAQTSMETHIHNLLRSHEKPGFHIPHGISVVTTKGNGREGWARAEGGCTF